MGKTAVHEQCRSCKWHLFDPDEGASVCVKPDSEAYMTYTPYDDVCGEWEKRRWNEL